MFSRANLTSTTLESKPAIDKEKDLKVCFTAEAFRNISPGLTLAKCSLCVCRYTRLSLTSPCIATCMRVRVCTREIERVIYLHSEL